MAHTYILQSKSLNRFYIGACHENLERRIENHNSGKYGSQTYTSQANDWVLFLKFECDDYSHAVRLERKLKSMKSRIYIENLARYSELREKVLNETSGT